MANDHEGRVEKRLWTKEEDLIILEAVEQGATKWSDISQLLRNREGKQCRERYYNHLDPKLKKSPWSHEEDLKLISLHAKLGNSWILLSNYFEGRSENDIKNRWNTKSLKLKMTSPPQDISHPQNDAGIGDSRGTTPLIDSSSSDSLIALVAGILDGDHQQQQRPGMSFSFDQMYIENIPTEAECATSTGNSISINFGDIQYIKEAVRYIEELRQQLFSYENSRDTIQKNRNQNEEIPSTSLQKTPFRVTIPHYHDIRTQRDDEGTSNQMPPEKRLRRNCDREIHAMADNMMNANMHQIEYHSTDTFSLLPLSFLVGMTDSSLSIDSLQWHQGPDINARIVTEEQKQQQQQQQQQQQCKSTSQIESYLHTSSMSEFMQTTINSWDQDTI